MAGTTPPKTTTLADDTLDAPQKTSPGDAPADTYDPKERASSAAPDKAAAAAAGHQTVNAVKLVGTIPDNAPTGTRTEVYDAPRPDGTKVSVIRNVDTGVTTAIPVVTSVVVTPATTSVAVGATRALTVKSQANTTLTTGVRFSTSDAAIATVNAAGVITGVAAGTVTVTATFGTRTGTTAVTVTA
ncbi:Ig-like domain-containing protein [Rhodococcus sp. IEGM 1366]|uniref:Ig-like domain-containing protein n=1 Tax=Rhodococcus sp. IEGM 1366 TaxID=3082223 RepID=UPI00295392D3|nr:Ig-like domain-containing protein [Rhodococcus sp. IEGM 1366]MDV8066394.1 Ig-like domain-containing protein [Rhodococcus sp. IEGM 1366]